MHPTEESQVGPKRFMCAVAAAVPCVLAAASPAVAAPHTYCVLDPSCVGTDVAGFQQALDAAKMHIGRDRVELGPTSFTTATKFSYAAAGHNSVDIVGAGSGETKIKTSQGGSATTLEINRGSVSDVEIEGPPSNGVGDFTVALDLTGHAERVRITGGWVNVVLAAGASIDHSTLTGGGLDYDRPAVLVSEGKATLADSTVDALHLGAHATGAGTLRVDRTTIAAQNGVYATNGGALDIHDSLIRAGGGASSNGITVIAKDDPAGAYATNVTIVGAGTPASVGVTSKSTGAGVQANLVLWNSVVTRAATSVRRQATAGMAYLAVNNSAYDASSQISEGMGAFEQNGGNLNVAQEFAGDDFHLPAGSPLIDAGDPVAGGVPVSDIDLDGRPRTTDGNGDGLSAPDIGAYEADAAAPAGPAEPPAGAPPTGDPNPQGDLKAPVLSALSLTHKRFRVRNAATAFRFKLSKAARVRVSIARKVKGKRRAAGKLSRAGRAGKNRIAFTGRIGKRALKPGRYVAVVQARDPEGRVSQKRTVRFTIVARPR
jgi:hypothetical protein